MKMLVSNLEHTWELDNTEIDLPAVPREGDWLELEPGGESYTVKKVKFQSFFLKKPSKFHSVVHTAIKYFPQITIYV
jgi:hypothetical protein